MAAKKTDPARLDRRARYTRTAIKDALLRLLEREHFDSLSVSSLCREADVGRSTFYTHYDTLIDIVDELADDAILATTRPEGNPFEAINSLADLLRAGSFTEEELQTLMLRLPVCQRVADDPKYRPLFRDPFISDYLLMQIYRRERTHMLPYLQAYGLSEREASALFLFLITGAFAVNREYDWKKDEDWLRTQRVLMTFIEGGYKSLEKL